MIISLISEYLDVKSQLGIQRRIIKTNKQNQAMVPTISCTSPVSEVELLSSHQVSSQGKTSFLTPFCVARSRTSTGASIERVKTFSLMNFTRQLYVNTIGRIYKGSTSCPSQYISVVSKQNLATCCIHFVYPSSFSVRNPSTEMLVWKQELVFPYL